jgi:hypothetical protein
MLHEILAAGYEITPEDIEADVIIVNTCAFIESAKKEAIDNILDVAWLKKNRHLKAIIVTGCLAERYGEEIFKELPEVDAVLGVGSIHNIVQAIETVTAKKKKGGAKVKYYSHEDKNTVRLGGDRVLTTPEYSAYIKIAEGWSGRKLTTSFYKHLRILLKQVFLKLLEPVGMTKHLHKRIPECLSKERSVSGMSAIAVVNHREAVDTLSNAVVHRLL